MANTENLPTRCEECDTPVPPAEVARQIRAARVPGRPDLAWCLCPVCLG